MTSKADKISAQIKATWKSCFRFTFAVALIVILVFLLFDLKQQRYQKEYESTDWREAEAVFDHNYYHQEREEDDDGYKYVDYYDWYFTYIMIGILPIRDLTEIRIPTSRKRIHMPPQKRIPL